MSKLSGASIAGMSSKVRERVENDYYATPFWATQAILEREPLNGSIWEPACGEGHMGKILKDFYPESKISCSDLVQRQDIFNIGIRGGDRFPCYRTQTQGQ